MVEQSSIKRMGFWGMDSALTVRVECQESIKKHGSEFSGIASTVLFLLGLGYIKLLKFLRVVTLQDSVNYF
jgi:hypothetical protein